MMSNKFVRALGTLAATLVIATAPSASHAEQFVLFDVTFTFTKADANNSRPSKSHYYVRGDRSEEHTSELQSQ